MKTVEQLRGIAEAKAQELAMCAARLREAREQVKILEKEYQKANLANEKARAEYILARDKELE